MTDSNPLILYDISSPLQPHSYAPNPSKARLALSFKSLPFKTTWVDIPDIPRVRSSLHCPAVRSFADGTPYPTLPMLHDPSADRVIGDSFAIAAYLEDTYPSSGNGNTLFPATSPSFTGLGLDYESPHKDIAFHAPLTSVDDAAGGKYPQWARFNWHVDATFSAHLALFGYFLPLNPSSAEEVKRVMAERAGLASWEQMRVEGVEARRALLSKMEEGLASLVALYGVNPSGPFLEGDVPSYADLVVGGWLCFLRAVAPAEEWEVLCGWGGGVLGRLFEVVRERFWVCT